MGRQPIPPSPLPTQPLTVGVIAAGLSLTLQLHCLPGASISPMGPFPNTPRYPFPLSPERICYRVRTARTLRSGNTALKKGWGVGGDVEREARKRDTSFKKKILTAVAQIPYPFSPRLSYPPASIWVGAAAILFPRGFGGFAPEGWRGRVGALPLLW